MAGTKDWRDDTLFARLVAIVDDCPLMHRELCDWCPQEKRDRCLRLWANASSQSGEHLLRPSQLEHYVRRFQRITA